MTDRVTDPRAYENMSFLTTTRVNLYQSPASPCAQEPWEVHGGTKGTIESCLKGLARGPEHQQQCREGQQHTGLLAEGAALIVCVSPPLHHPILSAFLSCPGAVEGVDP